MRELELKEKKIKEIQSTGDRLLREDHPARPTVEVRGACRDPSWVSSIGGSAGAQWMFVPVPSVVSTVPGSKSVPSKY